MKESTRKDLATEWILASEKIKTRDQSIPALAWLRKEQDRFERRTGRGTMAVVQRGFGNGLEYALAYAGLFTETPIESVVGE